MGKESKTRTKPTKTMLFSLHNSFCRLLNPRAARISWDTLLGNMTSNFYRRWDEKQNSKCENKATLKPHLSTGFMKRVMSLVNYLASQDTG